jgi:hypothetical protein
MKYIKLYEEYINENGPSVQPIEGELMKVEGQDIIVVKILKVNQKGKCLSFEARHKNGGEPVFVQYSDSKDAYELSLEPPSIQDKKDAGQTNPVLLRYTQTYQNVKGYEAR